MSRYSSSSSANPPFHLLEMNVISAQDLFPVSKPTRAYAVAWVNPERKLTTRTDLTGDTNPTWNDKFVFRVDQHFLNSDTSSIMIEIYATSWIRDVLIGTVAVLLSNLALPPSSSARKSKLRFVALQIRRPSGRPQGILNIGLTLLDSTMRSMPLYSKLSASALGHWDLMEHSHTTTRIKTNKKSIRTNPTPRHPLLINNVEKENHRRHRRPTFNNNYSNLMPFQRSQSERNDSSTIEEDYNYNYNYNYNITVTIIITTTTSFGKKKKKKGNRGV